MQSSTKSFERIQYTFNQNWSFQKGELGFEHTLEFDNAAWRKLDLLHDWAIEGPFDKKNDGFFRKP
jgi:beta-galactosidase